jgi:CubicO group peptidase (beta-lactamase class C family)
MHATLTRRRATRLLLSLPLLGMLKTASAQATAAAVDGAVAKAAATFMSDPRSVGLSVGVLHQGASHSFHFGSVSKRRQQLADAGTIYPIASLTKTFTGTLLARAQRDGKLKLDDDVRRYLDGDYPNLAVEGKPIRLFHLLNHRSGLPRSLPQNPEAEPGYPSKLSYAERANAALEKTTRADFYHALHAVVLPAPPGAKYAYSNAAAQLAGYVLERVYGKTYEALVREYIAGPLGMADTFIAPTPAQKQRIADGYEDEKLQPSMSANIQAAGALKSSLPDMLAYARWQMAEQDPVVLLAHQPTYSDGDFSIGLNWQLYTKETAKGPRRVIFQDGSTPGFACLVVLHPASQLAIVLLSNEIDRDAARRLAKMADSIAAALDPQAVALPSD